MRELPTGTVTFFFSDIEGSTRLLQTLGHDGFAAALDDHAEVLRTAIAAGGGVEVRTEGDSFFAVFPSATGALAAAVAAQRGLAERRWPDGGTMRVRIGLHSGEGVAGGDDYVGIDVHKAARVGAAGHGGQIVLSSTTRALVSSAMPQGASIRDLGPHTLKDFDEPEPLSDVVLQGLPSTFPPLRSLDVVRMHLPSPRTSFVGREDLVEELTVSVPRNRLTTLTGPGGTGKTRLAIEVARALQQAFADGVCFVDLSSIGDPELIPASIAAALRVRETPGADLATTLRAFLAERRLLLVLDNMEQLAEGSSVVASILDDAPEVAVIATSRIPLHLSGEVEIQIPPLSTLERVDDPDALLRSNEAVRLFVERAGEADPGFSLTGSNAADVQAIVERLDGLPLAVELAASRLRVLDTPSLLARLDERLPLLTGGPRDAPERHRTLEAAIRWSAEALDDDARHVFRRLAVFSGGWTLDAATSVCGDDVDVLTALSTLVDASLVRRLEDADGLRFRMLQTIREYAETRLGDVEPPDAIEELRRRHAGFFAAFAEAAGPHIVGEDQLEWLRRLDRESDNIRAAITWAVSSSEPADVATAMRTVAPLWRYWQQRGRLSEGRALLESLVDHPAGQARDATRVRALGALGGIEYWLADYEAMAPHYLEAVEIAREIGDRSLLASALLDRSFVWLLGGADLEKAKQDIQECLEVAEEPAVRARAWLSLGYASVFLGDVATADDAVERGIALLEEVDDRLALSESLVARSSLRWLGDDVEGAAAELRRATALLEESPSPLLLAHVLIPHALLSLKLERAAAAATFVGAWERLERDYDVNFPEQGRMFFPDPAEIRAALGDDAYERAWTEGFAMEVDEMVALVVGAHDVA